MCASARERERERIMNTREGELDALVNPRCNLTVRSGRRLKLPATAEQFQAAVVSEGSGLQLIYARVISCVALDSVLGG